jgi:hypothetical protein
MSTAGSNGVHPALNGGQIGRERGFIMSDNGRILTCVYCGHEYPQDTPASGSKALTDHIKVCEKHPMKKVIDDNRKLRAALVGLIGGADSRTELEQMEMFLQIAHIPDADKAATINAIHALIETEEVAAEETGNG